MVCAAIAIVSTPFRAQNPPAKPQFEVASVKPATDPSGRFSIAREFLRGTKPPGSIPMDNPARVRLENWALLDLIAAAYRVRATQVSGPAWLTDQCFEIEAKVPADAPKEDLNAMLQSLLEERFGLKVHRDTRIRQGFALVVGKKGSKLKPAEPPAATAEGLTEEERRAKDRQELQALLQENRERVHLVGLNRANFSSVTTEQLAFRLVGFAGAPVVDETGLTGKYSVTLKTWKNDDVPGGTVFDAVEKLGLKLEARKVTVETVVVDQVSKTPTAN